MDHNALLWLTGAFLVYGLVSGRLRGSVLTGPMLFTAFGLLVGPAGFGWVTMQLDNAGLHLLAEITLILVLFADATGIDFRQLRRDHNLPARVLAFGLPATVLLGTLAATVLLAGFTLWEAALVAAMLAPTDAALGQAVVSDPAVPLRVRQTLNVESGLNDGLALPLVLIFAALASAEGDAAGARDWLAFAAAQVGLGPLAGLIVGYVGARLVALCHRIGWLSETAEGLIALALAFGSYAAAEAVHGNGFIAAFVAGLTFGNTLRHKCRYLYEFAETEGTILVLLTFTAFGAVMIPATLPAMSLHHLLFALLALTLLRMLPVALALLGSGVRPTTTLFIGWFGPRGLASVLFVLLILEQSEVPHADGVLAVVVLTVALSVLLHGLSAGPVARRYAARCERMQHGAEHKPVAGEPFSDGQ